MPATSISILLCDPLVDEGDFLRIAKLEFGYVVLKPGELGRQKISDAHGALSDEDGALLDEGENIPGVWIDELVADALVAMPSGQALLVGFPTGIPNWGLLAGSLNRIGVPLRKVWHFKNQDLRESLAKLRRESSDLNAYVEAIESNPNFDRLTDIKITLESMARSTGIEVIEISCENPISEAIWRGLLAS